MISDLSPEKLSQEYYADRIMKLSESITEAYVASDAGIPTDTLLTKILLGTVGCVPAYDRYFKKAHVQDFGCRILNSSTAMFPELFKLILMVKI